MERLLYFSVWSDNQVEEYQRRDRTEQEQIGWNWLVKRTQNLAISLKHTDISQHCAL
jgi:hypothetical protein